MPISAESSYRSWPYLAEAENGSIVCAYSVGTQHALDTTRKAVCRITDPDNPEGWGSEITIADTGSVDDAVFAMAPDLNGDLGAWVRRRTAADAFSSHYYRSTDSGASWSLVDSPTLSPQPVLVFGLRAIEGVGLLAWWHAGPESDEADRSYGTIKSTDHGENWTQTTIATGVADTAWPCEGRFVDIGDGELLGLGRNEAAAALYQLHSEDGGDNWTVSSTNITDQARTPTGLIFDGSLLHAYYFHRGSGILRHRSVAPATVIASPMSWPASTAIASGQTASVTDAGSPSALQVGDRHWVAFYNGTASVNSIRLMVL